jgi:predicted ATPase
VTAIGALAASLADNGVAALAGSAPCSCDVARHTTKYVAVTGGPGSGKTAILELARRRFCAHVRVLPEVATMLFAGGFPRLDSTEAIEGAQRAISTVQRELELVVAVDGKTAVALCDRGTLDGLAYWPGSEENYFVALRTTREAELARYAAVVHLRTPPAKMYNHSNPMRTESAAHARAIDERIAVAWRGHPNVHFVESRADFLEKARQALAVVEHELPACCRAVNAATHAASR